MATSIIANLNIKQIFDFNIFGSFNANGNIITLTGKQAYFNALRIWLLNKEGDYLRNPTRGGYLYNWLCKPMSDTNAGSIELSLKTGLTKDFSSTLTIYSLSVVPDYNKGKWTITVLGYDSAIKEDIDFVQDFYNLV